MGRLRAARGVGRRFGNGRGSRLNNFFSPRISGRGRSRGTRGEGLDEEAIAEAEDTMRSMTGNAGQDAILDEAMDAFVDWAHRALEEPGAMNEWPDVLELREDKYDGTDEIWDEGFRIIAEASGNHDSTDEQGEGAGEVFDPVTTAD